MHIERDAETEREQNTCEPLPLLILTRAHRFMLCFSGTNPPSTCFAVQLGRPVCKDLKDSSGEYKVEEIFQEHLRPAPVLIDGDTAAGVKVVGCGAYHSLLSITTTGKTYATGGNEAKEI